MHLKSQNNLQFKMEEVHAPVPVNDKWHTRAWSISYARVHI
jgi:hypothetical protein